MPTLIQLRSTLQKSLPTTNIIPSRAVGNSFYETDFEEHSHKICCICFVACSLNQIYKLDKLPPIIWNKLPGSHAIMLEETKSKRVKRKPIPRLHLLFVDPSFKLGSIISWFLQTRKMSIPTFGKRIFPNQLQQIFDGKAKVAKEVIDGVDEKNKTVIFRVIEGDLLEIEELCGYSSC
ncbi:hypothetical protein RJ640_001957 [Escallonia rubra]|uniref:Bet v I/Major latex protein domain-containing protein n=1 Tax=Escallonia rubra TaxID=112253 RepID=A0AA88R8N4_9ASTE|nr:hypothetical protein RJ640_001957 [Escallonia rubra]